MNRLHLVCYADDTHGVKGGLFRERQERLVDSARNAGITHIHALRKADLQKTQEYNAHPEYFNLHPYQNGYAFKPVVIRSVVEKLSDGDILYYSDCIPQPIPSNVHHLVNWCISSGGWLFAEYGDPNRVWTKASVFRAMDCDSDRFRNCPHIVATWFMFVVSPETRKLLEEWCHYNTIQGVAEGGAHSHDTLGDPSEECTDYRESRWDQSILSNLVEKYHAASCFGMGFGQNKIPARFLLSMWTGSLLPAMLWRLMGRFK